MPHASSRGQVAQPAVAGHRVGPRTPRARPPAPGAKPLAPICWIVTRRLALEHDRVGHVPAVEADEVGLGATGRASPFGEHERRAGVGRGSGPCPRAADVVLEAGAADRRQVGVAVAVHLHLALAVPVGVVDDAHADVAAEEPPGPRRPSAMTKSRLSAVGFSRRKVACSRPRSSGSSACSV